MATPQIWQVSYPSGARSRVTNDLNSYMGASLSADGKSLATVQTEVAAGIYVVDKPGAAPRRVSGGGRREDGIAGLTWLPSGRLVFTSTASGLPQLWIVDADGENLRQLTSLKTPATNPSASPDGKWIYFSSFAAEGFCLFRVAPDGSGLQQITRDGDARSPIVSRDGATVYFMAMRSGVPKLMKVAAEGGTAAQLVDRYFRLLDLSPDGSRVLGVTWNETERRPVLAALSLGGGAIEMLPDSPTTSLYMPDGSLTLVQRIARQNPDDFAPDRRRLTPGAGRGRRGLYFRRGDLARRTDRDLTRHLVKRRGAHTQQVGSAHGLGRLEP